MYGSSYKIVEKMKKVRWSVQNGKKTENCTMQCTKLKRSLSKIENI